MNVAELIAALQGLPADLPVIAMDRAVYTDIEKPEIEHVSASNAFGAGHFGFANEGQPGAFRAVVL